jgi:tripartite-type tricarboxylate transporter receptor subunit TctC
MRLPHRKFLHVAAVATLFALTQFAWAQNYPTRPVRLFEGFGGGGAPDLVSRLIGQWLSERLGQPFVIENRTGASGNIATEAVVTAPADGYTLLTCLSANAVNASLYQHLDFNFLHDMVPVAGLVQLPMILLVNPTVPAKTLPEFLAYAKSNPGKINIATPGNGTPMQVAAALLKQMTGINIVPVAYRGPAAAYVDLLAGQVQAMFITTPSSLGYLSAGKLRGLALTGAARSPVLPDIPTVAEFVPGFAATAWDGVCAPRGTPKEIIDKLNSTINAGLADPKIKARLNELGGDPMIMTPAQFGTFLVDETAKWGKVIREANIKPE